MSSELLTKSLSLPYIKESYRKLKTVPIYTTHSQLEARLRISGVYLHSPVRLHGVGGQLRLHVPVQSGQLPSSLQNPQNATNGLAANKFPWNSVLKIFTKICRKFSNWLKSHKSNRHCLWGPTYTCHWSL